MDQNEQLIKICELLKQLSAAPVNPDIFGARVHRFILNPPLTEAAILDFERQHAIRLPEDYRSFLTLAGNGGAGPAYGLFKLGEMDDNFSYMEWQENDGFVGRLSKPFPYTQVWNDLEGMPEDETVLGEDEYETQMTQFEHRYYAAVDGAIPICHLGCALRQWLVVCGVEAGYIWCDFRADYRGFSPLTLPGQTRVTFLQWYQDWLTQCSRHLA